MLFLRTAFETIIQSSTVTKWVRKETLLVNLGDKKTKRTEHINLLIMFSIASRAGVGVGVGEYSVFSRWKLSCHLWFLQQWKSWGEKSNCTKGGKQQSKERRGPLSIHSSATCKPNMSSGIKDRKLVILTPIKTPAPQAGLSRKETWESWRKSPGKAKKPSKLLSQQVYNQTELTPWEIKYFHQVYCCL